MTSTSFPPSWRSTARSSPRPTSATTACCPDVDGVETFADDLDLLAALQLVAHPPQPPDRAPSGGPADRPAASVVRTWRRTADQLPASAHPRRAAAARRRGDHKVDADVSRQERMLPGCHRRRPVHLAERPTTISARIEAEAMATWPSYDVLNKLTDDHSARPTLLGRLEAGPWLPDPSATPDQRDLPSLPCRSGSFRLVQAFSGCSRCAMMSSWCDDAARRAPPDAARLPRPAPGPSSWTVVLILDVDKGGALGVVLDHPGPGRGDSRDLGEVSSSSRRYVRAARSGPSRPSRWPSCGTALTLPISSAGGRAARLVDLGHAHRAGDQVARRDAIFAGCAGWGRATARRDRQGRLVRGLRRRLLDVQLRPRRSCGATCCAPAPASWTWRSTRPYRSGTELEQHVHVELVGSAPPVRNPAPSTPDAPDPNDIPTNEATSVSRYIDKDS